jgi:hypothetical protein
MARGHMDNTSPEKRQWHVSKEIPVALLISIAASLFLGGIAYQALKSDIVILQNTQKEMRDESKEVVAEVKLLSNRMQEGSVPSAQNSWRFTQVEAGIAEAKVRIQAIEARVMENERKLSQTENSGRSTAARLRAQAER